MSTVCNGNVMDGQGDYEGAVVLKDEADGVCIRIMQQIGKGGEGGGAAGQGGAQAGRYLLAILGCIIYGYVNG